MRKLLSLLLLVGLVSAASWAAPGGKALLGDFGFDLAQLDRNVKTCDDFYGFAVGGWRKAHPLPPTYARYGRFEEIGERSRDVLRGILEEAAKAPGSPGSDSQKIGDFWAACMDEAAIEKQGIAPIQADLQRIDAIRDRVGVVTEIHRMQQRPGGGGDNRGGNPVFRLGAQNDYKNSDMIIATVGQGGLGLPDRDYYLRDDERLKTTRTQYRDHIARMFQLIGMDAAQATADAERVVALETELARASMPRVAQRDPAAIYHMMPVAELDAFAPNLHFSQLFTDAGLADLKSLNVAQPDFIKEANRLVEALPVESWRAYLRWNTIDAVAPFLSSKFADADFEFRNRVLVGQEEIQPRWQRCVRAADQGIGQLIGKEYVKRVFTPEAKRKMNELIDNLVAALNEGIPQLEWMSGETKQAALGKLKAFKRRIGYPDEWRDYSTLKVSRDSYLSNIHAAREYNFRRTVERIGKPDDPDEWGRFTPPTVNAVYNPARNFITFPAGILQPPFYDPNADDAYNYGGIGTVIGHEMTHGFDDQGAKFDAHGNVSDWWTPADVQRFAARTQCITDQYSEFNVEEGLNIQGKLVTGEAIADLGGATLALRAYEKSLEGKERKTIDGFTPEQRFFLGFAQVWGENMAAAEARRRALTDPHAQGRFRVNGTVSNMPEFQRAWSCPETAKMVREASKRCSIW